MKQKKKVVAEIIRDVLIFKKHEIGFSILLTEKYFNPEMITSYKIFEKSQIIARKLFTPPFSRGGRM